MSNQNTAAAPQRFCSYCGKPEHGSVACVAAPGAPYQPTVKGGTVMFRDRYDHIRDFHELCALVDTLAGKKVMTRECPNWDWHTNYGRRTANRRRASCEGSRPYGPCISDCVPLPEAEAFVAALEWLRGLGARVSLATWFDSRTASAFIQRSTPVYDGRGATWRESLFAAMWEMVQVQQEAKRGQGDV